MTNELGDFLRARRADPSLEPPIPTSAGRRRVLGLRREEVALASGISVDYYTRLEQGRENQPSDAVVESLARTLDLAADAKEHLYRLRGTVPAVRRGTDAADEALARRMVALVETMSPNPAYVLDRLSNIVASNAEGLSLHAGLSEASPRLRNTCRYLMTDPRARQIFGNWEEIARGAVAHLRAANADNLQDPELQELVSSLSEQSALFAEWWSEHIVERRRASTAQIRTVSGEVLTRRYEVLHVPDEALRVTIWLPEANLSGR